MLRYSTQSGEAGDRPELPGEKSGLGPAEGHRFGRDACDRGPRRQIGAIRFSGPVASGAASAWCQAGSGIEPGRRRNWPADPDGPGNREGLRRPDRAAGAVPRRADDTGTGREPNCPGHRGRPSADRAVRQLSRPDGIRHAVPSPVPLLVVLVGGPAIWDRLPLTGGLAAENVACRLSLDDGRCWTNRTRWRLQGDRCRSSIVRERRGWFRW